MATTPARKDVIKRLVEAALEALTTTEADATDTEITSASFTLLNLLIERVLEHSQPEHREHNRQSAEKCLMLILKTVRGTQRPH